MFAIRKLPVKFSRAKKAAAPRKATKTIVLIGGVFSPLAHGEYYYGYEHYHEAQ